MNPLAAVRHASVAADRVEPWDPYDLAVVADGPLGYWRCADGYNAGGTLTIDARDDIGHNDFTGPGASVARLSRPPRSLMAGGGFRAIGISDLSIVAPPAEFQVAFTGNFTVEVWLRSAFTAQGSTSANRFMDGGPGFDFWSTDKSRVIWNAGTAPGDNPDASLDICSDTDWHHVVGTVENAVGSSTWKTYIDGVLCRTVIDDEITLETDPPGSLGMPGTFDGDWSRLAYYDHAIDATAVAAHYAAAGPPLDPLGPADLPGYLLHFDAADLTADHVHDDPVATWASTGGSLTRTLAQPAVDNQPLYVDTDTVDLAPAVRFNNFNQWLILPGIGARGGAVADDWSIYIVWRPDVLGANNTLLANRGFGYDDNIYLGIDPLGSATTNNKLAAAFERDEGTVRYVATMPDDPPMDAWNIHCVRANGSVLLVENVRDLDYESTAAIQAGWKDRNWGLGRNLDVSDSHFGGDIAEVIWFDDYHFPAPSNPDDPHTIMREYLRARYP